MPEPRGAEWEAARGWPWRTYLITASTAGLLAVTVMSATVQLPILPEVDHVDQEFTTDATDETSRVPEFIIASPFRIDGWVSFLHGQSAAVTGLGERAQTTTVRALGSQTLLQGLPCTSFKRSHSYRHGNAECTLPWSGNPQLLSVQPMSFALCTTTQHCFLHGSHLGKIIVVFTLFYYRSLKIDYLRATSKLFED